MLNGERPQVRSNGKFVRDYFYIGDGAAAYMLLAKRPELRGAAYNFSTELPLTVTDVVERIAHAMKWKITPEILNQATNEIPEQFLSATKAKQDSVGSRSTRSTRACNVPSAGTGLSGSCRKQVTHCARRSRSSWSRVFDEQEIPLLGQLVSGFWLTTGRFAERFSKEPQAAPSITRHTPGEHRREHEQACCEQERCAGQMRAGAIGSDEATRT